ncbi:MAG: CPBP family intramembrane metalloprotease [Bacteroidetes bacterium]|jgi:membrane protease YdiL (CAAX protease family)|nr:CPBP family intramembrane metalloprotease [Bacteroidota bacterium]
MAILALVLALVLFQVVITPLVLVLLLIVQGVQITNVVGDMPALMAEQAHTIIGANTAGQLLALAVPAFLLARLHSARPQAFLRLRAPDGRLLLLALIGLVVLMPVVQWLGTVNEWLPLPEAIREFDQQQMDLVERVLRGDLGLVFSLLTLAVTPALCEELLFRGYVQRQAERGLGAAGGIVLSGLVFGLYHLRLTQALPLIALGLYLAYLAWRTGSLWVPIVVHFANNAFAVALGLWAEAQDGMDLQAIEQLSVPWYLVLGGALLAGGTLYLLDRRARVLLGHTAPDAPIASMNS